MKKALAIILLTSKISAAPQTEMNHFLMEEINVRTGMNGQFESAQKDYCAAVVKGGAPACLIFSTATFGPSNRYLVFLPFSSFIHYDQGKYTDKGLTPDEARTLSARRIPPIESGYESALQWERQLSFSKAPYAVKPLSLFTEYQLRPGTSEAFLALVHRTLLPAARLSGVAGFQVLRTLVGASPDRVFIVTRLDNFAQLDKIDATAADPAWRAFLKQNVLHTDTFLMNYRVDLSTDLRAPELQ